MSSTSLTLEEALRGWQECAAELARVRAERDHYLTALTGVVEQKEQQRVRAAKAEARLAALEATDGD